MKKLLGLVICFVLLFSCNDNEKTELASESNSVADKSAAESKDYEIGDMKLVDIAKKSSQYLESGDIDSWMTIFADNATYRWNNLDSVVSKAAISDYWKKRRTDIIDSISFSNEIWTALKVNRAQSAMQMTGNYVLGWHLVYARYKTGKSMTQRIHTSYHFNDAGLIDRVSTYMDRALINAAMEK
jgi:ketosteroid isomerase-like protein